MIRPPRPSLAWLVLTLGAASAPAPGVAADPPHGQAVLTPDARVRSAPPDLAPTDQRIPFGTAIDVVEETTVRGARYARVRQRAEPRAELGWTAAANLGSEKEIDPGMRPDDAVDADGLRGLPAVMAGVYNARGKYLKERADALGVSPAMLAAVLQVESGGRGFGPDGRAMIRFENHIFRGRWGDANAERFDRHFRFDPKEKWKGHEWRKAESDPWAAFHGTQASEWTVFEFAKSLDEPAALASASYGVGQIMGFNHKAVGYDSAGEMVRAFDRGIRPQLDAMVAFIRNNRKCMEGLKANNPVRFAEGYNGTGKAEAYGQRIREAADAYATVTKGKKSAE